MFTTSPASSHMQVGAKHPWQTLLKEPQEITLAFHGNCLASAKTCHNNLYTVVTSL